MADDLRLRGLKYKPGFKAAVKYRCIEPTTGTAKLLSKAIGDLRKSKVLPFGADVLVEFWGQESCYAHAFAYRLWLYYSFDDDYVILWNVQDHIHNDPAE